MKATITRPDGTRIEAEGTPEEIAKLAPLPYVPIVPLPATQGCTCYTIWPCPLHAFRWPGICGNVPALQGAANVCAAAVPNMGQVWVGEVKWTGGLAWNPPASAAGRA